MIVGEGLEVADVIRRLREKIEGFAQDFTDETLVVLNDRVVLRDKGQMEPKPVKEGDVIGIFPAVSGGTQASVPDDIIEDSQLIEVHEDNQSL